MIPSLFLFHVFSGCIDDQTFEMKTVGVGDDVKLTCTSKSLQSLNWIRVVPKNLPEVIGRSFRFQSSDFRIKTSEEHDAFVLHIQKTKLRDTGVYYCMEQEPCLTFLKGIDLRVKHPKRAFRFSCRDNLWKQKQINSQQ